MVGEDAALVDACQPAFHMTLTMGSVGGFAAEQCANTCAYANNGECDDGGMNASSAICDHGTDCNDCGIRVLAEHNGACYAVDECFWQGCGSGGCVSDEVEIASEYCWTSLSFNEYCCRTETCPGMPSQGRYCLIHTTALSSKTKPTCHHVGLGCT